MTPCRDDYGRLPLHWAAELGLSQLCGVLLEATAAAAAHLAQQVAAAAAAATDDEQMAAAGAMQQQEQPNSLEMQVRPRAECVRGLFKCDSVM